VRSRRPSTLRVMCTHAGLVLFTGATLYPVLWVLKMALTPSQAFSLGVNPWPTDPSWVNFVEVVGWGEEGALFLRQAFNSIVIATSTAALGLALSTTAAYALSRWNFPGKDRSMEAFLVTQMFPGVVMAIPLYILLDLLGLLDTMTGLILVYSTTSVPFSVWMLKGYFDTIPVELEEAARLDGASRWMTFTHIILPLARPALAVTGLFSFMTAWNEFILAATFLNDRSSFTLPVVLQRYVSDYGTDWGHFAAGAVLVSLPVMLLFFVLQKHFVEGLTAGSVKG
jgi:arabinogalactan oligomer/maltooligosaccharide transport system permease protein